MGQKLWCGYRRKTVFQALAQPVLCRLTKCRSFRILGCSAPPAMACSCKVLAILSIFWKTCGSSPSWIITNSSTGKSIFCTSIQSSKAGRQNRKTSCSISLGLGAVLEMRWLWWRFLRKLRVHGCPFLASMEEGSTTNSRGTFRYLYPGVQSGPLQRNLFERWPRTGFKVYFGTSNASKAKQEKWPKQR